MAEEIVSQMQERINQLESELESQKTSTTKAFMSKSLKFFSRMTGQFAKIQFPKTEEVLEEPSLIKQMSRNTFLTHTLSRINDEKQKKSKLEEEISAQEEKLRKEFEAKVTAMKQGYAPILEERQQKLKSLVNSISSEITGSIICDDQKAYLVDSFDSESLKVLMVQLLDNNGIAFEDTKEVSKNLEDLGTLSALPRQEAEAFLSNLENNKIRIQYQIVTIDENEQICCPVHIEPSGISLQNYEIRFNKEQNQINEVVNKEEGKVRFEAIQISDECGLVQESLIEVFTEELSPNILNVVHVHLDDMKEEVPIEAVYILPEQSSEDYQEWKLDARGLELRYKVIVKNGQVQDILYNTGNSTEKLHFIERRIKLGDYLRIDEGSIAQVTGVPTGLLARDWKGMDEEVQSNYNVQVPQGFCQKRHLEEMPGLLDIKILMVKGELQTSPKEVSMPVCQCEELSEAEKQEVTSYLSNLDLQKKQTLENSLVELKEKLKSWVASQELLDELRELTFRAREALTANESLRPKWGSVLNQADRTIRLIATELRYS